MELALISLAVSAISLIVAIAMRRKSPAPAPAPMPEFIPRTWNIPEKHHAAIYKARAAYHACVSSDVARVGYFLSLHKAGFDGFGHGGWCYDHIGFPFGRLVECEQAGA